MDTDHRNAAAALRVLIRACVDEEQTLHHESRYVDDERARIFSRLAKERHMLIARLERLERLGDKKRDHSQRASWRERLREAARTGWVLAAGRNYGDAVTMCRHSRARTEASFDRALDLTWPEPIRAELTADRDRVHAETDVLNRLLL